MHTQAKHTTHSILKNNLKKPAMISIVHAQTTYLVNTPNVQATNLLKSIYFFINNMHNIYYCKIPSLNSITP